MREEFVQGEALPRGTCRLKTCLLFAFRRRVEIEQTFFPRRVFAAFIQPFGSVGQERERGAHGVLHLELRQSARERVDGFVSLERGDGGGGFNSVGVDHAECLPLSLQFAADGESFAGAVSLLYPTSGAAEVDDLQGRSVVVVAVDDGERPPQHGDATDFNDEGADAV